MMFNFLKNIVVAMLIFLAGELVGFNGMESYHREMAQTAQLSLEDLYQEKMIKQDLVVLDRFPPQLQEMRHARAGTLIFSNGVDSLYFVRADVIDGEKTYTLEDGHDKWYAFPGDGRFYISKKRDKNKRKIFNFGT